MGGVIGATSGKFVLIAATLLFHGRVDNARSTIALVPGAPRSAISEMLASRLKRGEPVTIGIGAEYLRASIDLIEPDPGKGADLRIGQDILDVDPIEIDFTHHRLRLLLASEAKRAERGMVAIPVVRQRDGTMTVPLKLDDAAPIAVMLDLANSASVTTPTVGIKTIAVGSFMLDKADIVQGEVPSVGLGAFAKMRIIFDLGHSQIWIAAQSHHISNASTGERSSFQRRPFT